MFVRLAFGMTAVLLVTSSVRASEIASAELRAPSTFDLVRNRTARSIALFMEAGKVLQHPRCLNCHPVERQPTQGDDMHAHMPPVQAGPENRGTNVLPCSSCHSKENTPTLGTVIKSIPGSDHWALAPASMAWQGRTIGEICQQLKDPVRNGNRTLAQIEKHMVEDHLVGWAWHPGDGRTPAPGTQVLFGELIAAWVETGAHCPSQ